MKRRSPFLLLLCSALLFPGNSLGAQELGAKFSLARSHADISQEIPGITFQSMTDFSAGIFLSIDLIGGQLGLQPEVNYIVKGFDAREMDQGEEISSKYKISYITTTAAAIAAAKGIKARREGKPNVRALQEYHATISGPDASC